MKRSRPRALPSHWIRKLLLVLVSVALASACSDDGGGASDGANDSGKKIFFDARSSAHKSLDPMRQFDGASAEIIMNVYDTLLEYHYLHRPYRLAPNLLADMPEPKSDGVTDVFRLRRGIHFHDDPCFPGGKGRELVADDAIYSIKRFADAHVNKKSYVLLKGYIKGLDEFREQTRERPKDAGYADLDVAGVRKIDDYTFEVEWNRRNPLALFPFAMTTLSIVPREAVERYGDDFANHPVGTGPFSIKTYARRGTMVLEKNPNYHLRYPTEGGPGDEAAGLLGPAGQKLPFLDEIHMPLIEEPQPAMLKFKRAELDWIGIDKDNFPDMAYRDDAGQFHLKDEFALRFEMYAEARLSSEYFSFNFDDPVVGKNKALRQAIAYALDARGFLDLLRNGRGLPLSTIVPHPIAGSQEDPVFGDFVYYPQDRELAKKKLAEAGYPGGQGLPPLVFEYRSATKDARQGFEYVRNELAQIGIVARANFSTFSAFLKKQESRNFMIASAGWQADYPDAENFYQLLYGPNRTPGPNSSGFDDPSFNALYEQIRFMENGPERFALFRKMAGIAREEVPLLLRFNAIAFGIYQKNVKYMKRHLLVDKPYKYLDKEGSAVP